MTLQIEPELALPLRVNRDGVILVGDTCISLGTVIGAFEQGHTVGEIVRQYPPLNRVDVYLVIGYYLRHLAEVRAYVMEEPQQTVETRQIIQAQADTAAWRDRLLARPPYRKEPAV
ncbi:MAG: DUF433 domain-containing protein [Chloroflexota bacterium]|nr:DUF433 domain-containing protein [Chloroflexota bacterium]